MMTLAASSSGTRSECYDLGSVQSSRGKVRGYIVESNGHVMVSPGHVAGFGTDVGDMADQFWDLAGKALRSVELPAGATGLLAGLIAPLGDFRDRTSDAHQRDRARLYKLSGGLSEAGRLYHGRDQNNARSLNLFDTGVGISSTLDETCWGGAQFPDAVGPEGLDYSVKNTVDWAIGVLSPFAENLKKGAGVNPIADYLAPVACDWEDLRPLSEEVKRLGSLSHGLVSNMDAGAEWLAEKWQGVASNAFMAAKDEFGRQAGERAENMNHISDVIRKGGEYIERVVKNQARSLVSELMRPVSLIDFTLPLCLWGALLDHPLFGEAGGEVRSGVAAMEEAAKTRHGNVNEILDQMHGALRSSSSIAARNISNSIPELPPESKLAYSNATYGFKNKIWREENFAPTR